MPYNWTYADKIYVASFLFLWESSRKGNCSVNDCGGLKQFNSWCVFWNGFNSFINLYSLPCSSLPSWIYSNWFLQKISWFPVFLLKKSIYVINKGRKAKNSFFSSIIGPVANNKSLILHHLFSMLRGKTTYFYISLSHLCNL